MPSSDVESKDKKEKWLYSDIVKEHFFDPKNFMVDDEGYVASGMGMVGSPACGDMMTVWIKVDKAGDRIALKCTLGAKRFDRCGMGDF